MATRFAWLIENGKQGGELRYRSMDQGQPTWTTSPHEALDFSRREDAERFAAEDEDAWRIVEHGFDDPAPNCFGDTMQGVEDSMVETFEQEGEISRAEMDRRFVRACEEVDPFNRKR